ncbi:hypothetical protein HHK36_009038 [Tetracentron sinense]|uniref:Protein FAR1-RELATED SEQUENCE n=1 Tax=Tetracentron sinense TaxID=13715 RepID=A0A835DHZ6_TETSI|nr:hypothetical protein HHK36_009038 [Tetracentron sinense]
MITFLTAQIDIDDQRTVLHIQATVNSDNFSGSAVMNFKTRISKDFSRVSISPLANNSKENFWRISRFFYGDFLPRQMDTLFIESCMILDEGEKSDEIGTLLPQNENIDLALKKIVDKEESEDDISEHKNRIRDKNNLILKRVAKIYARNIFEKFQRELEEFIRYKVEDGENDGEYQTYIVKSKVGISEEYVVKLKLDTYEGMCGCQHFEFTGILCRHILKVIARFDVVEIPTQFILKRWIQEANKARVVGKDEITMHDTQSSSEAMRLSHICRISAELACVASKSEKAYKIVLDTIDELFIKVSNQSGKANNNIDEFLTVASTQQDDFEVAAEHHGVKLMHHGLPPDTPENISSIDVGKVCVLAQPSSLMKDNQFRS